MKKIVITILGMAFALLRASSLEFPITTATGDQRYPDVCWDGEAFWVVWQDDAQGTIRGIRVDDKGEFLTNEVELLNKGTYPGPVRYPCLAAAPDRIAVEARKMVGYDEFGNDVWGVVHREFSRPGDSLYNTVGIVGSLECLAISAPIVMFGKEHFFSLFKASHETPEDFHAWSMCVGLDSTGSAQQDIWLSSTVHGEFEPSTGCWGGKRFLVITSCWDSGVFLDDSMIIQGIGWNFQLGRDVYRNPNDDGCIKYQTLTSSKTNFFLASEIWEMGVSKNKYKIGFDLLDSTGMPVKDSATIADLGDEIKLYSPDAAYGKENFVCCWENRFSNNTSHLYAIEVDTLGGILKSGYVVQKSPVDKQPAIAFGGDKYLLVWTDNHEGNFNIYGKLFDTLEVFEGIEETPEPFEECVLKASPNPFRDKVELFFSRKGGENQTMMVFIYDALGRRVNALELKPGEERILWEGRDAGGRVIPAGVYFIQALDSRNQLKTAKVVLVR
ncbi:hypothetical protein GX441_06625 [bacterium]|nr:hypothetical protein [bacterium]